MNRNGFTLIELLVAVAIVGALAAIALPAYTQYVQRGHNVEAKAALTAWAAALHAEYMDTRRYSCIAKPENTEYFSYACALDAAHDYVLSATSTTRLDAKRALIYSLDGANRRQTTIKRDGNNSNSNCWLTDLNSTCN